MAGDSGLTSETEEATSTIIHTIVPAQLLGRYSHLRIFNPISRAVSDINHQGSHSNQSAIPNTVLQNTELHDS